MTNFLRVFLSLSLVCAAVLVFPDLVSGCTCPIVKAKERVEIMKDKADLIFQGRVKLIKEGRERIGDTSYKETVLTVSKLLKGEREAEFTVYSDFGCEIPFEVGETFLVFAVRDDSGRMFTELCWGTALTKFRKKEIRLLGKPLSEVTSVVGKQGSPGFMRDFAPLAQREALL
jgi:hypothetical protein